MKPFIAPICCIILAGVAMGQERGTSVGSPGGARSQQPESRRASLAAANDAELKPYANLISTELKSNVRATRRELDNARKKIPGLPVAQFLVTKDVAQTYKLQVERIVTEMAGVRNQGPAFAAATVTSEEFFDILAQTVHKVKPDVSAEEAKKQASSALAKVNIVPTD